MNQSTISNCGTGFETEDATNVQIISSKMVNNSDYAIFYKTKAENIFQDGEKKKIVSKIDELHKLFP